MSPTAQIQALAQSVYLRIKNRLYDDLTSTDGKNYITAIMDFANGWLDEFETQTTPSGDPLYWKAVTQLGYPIGTATAGTATVTLPTAVNDVIVEQDRYVQVTFNGTVVSNFLVVAPEQITNISSRVTSNMCTVTGRTVTFSRLFTANENTGTIIADVTTYFPRLSLTSVNSIALVKPRELLVLGIAKNAALPDIVKGSLTPSFVQKYQQLLDGAVAKNQYGGQADTADTDDYGYVRGIY